MHKLTKECSFEMSEVCQDEPIVSNPTCCFGEKLDYLFIIYFVLLNIIVSAITVYLLKAD